MKTGIACLAVLLLAAAIYSIGLSGPLVFDDVQNLAPLTQWLAGQRSWESVVFENGSGIFGRPVAMASLMLNVTLLGPEVSTLKLGNLLLHLANGVLVYVLLGKLLTAKALVRDTPTSSHWIALLGMALWLLHPLLASTVLYVIQRMAMLAAFFTLVAMIAYASGRLALGAGHRRRAAAWFALVPVATVVGALSKENGALALALCAVMELFVFAPPPGKKRSWGSRAVIFFALVLPAGLAIWAVLAGHPLVTSGYVNRPFTLSERLLTEGRVLWSYIGSIVLPLGPRLGLYHDDYPISQGLVHPATTLVALLAWATVIGVAWRLRRAVPGFALGLGIFLVAQALESTIFPLLPYFEHRNYLPAVGAIWALMSMAVFGWTRLDAGHHRSPRLLVFAAIALVLVYSFATAGRAIVWQSRTSILAQASRQHPDSRWLRVALIQQAMTQKPPAAAVARENASRLSLSDDPSTRRLGAVLDLMIVCSAGHVAPEPLVAQAFEGIPEPIEADLLVAFESLSEGLIRNPCRGLAPGLAANELASMLDRSSLPMSHPSIWRLRLKSAKLAIAAGKPDLALKQATLAWSDGAGEPPAALLLAALHLRQGNLPAARHVLDAVRPRIPTYDSEGWKLLRSYEAELDRRQSGTNGQAR